MSRPELLESLRQATPSAPAELRGRVLELAAAAPPPRRLARRFTLAAVAIAVLAAAVVAVSVLEPSNSPGRPVAFAGSAATAIPQTHAQAPTARAAVPGALATPAISAASVLPPPSGSRAQRYTATLRLRLLDGTAVAAAARRAVQIAEALGGYPQSVSVSVSAPAGSARIVLRVPRGRVETAVDRLAALGTVLGERASISDLQAGVDTTGLRIVRLERELAAAIHATPTPQSRRLIAALTTQIEGLQRARAATLAASRDATVSLALATPTPKPPHHVVRQARRGPFHDLGVVFRRAGVVAVYILALGTPLAVLALGLWLLASRLRRRRDERLLSRN